jgi:hypothetical protein
MRMATNDFLQLRFCPLRSLWPDALSYQQPDDELDGLLHRRQVHWPQASMMSLLKTMSEPCDSPDLSAMNGSWGTPWAPSN